MSNKQLELPSIYKERPNNPVPERYKKYIGRPAMSYSTYTAFKEEGYRGEWLANKFLGIPSEGSIFTEFGSSVGNYQETGKPQPYLSENDMRVLDNENPANPEAEYEREVVIDRGSYILYGFIDRVLGVKNKKIDLADFKTGSIEKKAKEYASEDYQQTTMYCYGLEQEGFEIKSSGVILFDRKGNTLEQGNKNVLRLTGGVEYIDTPYSKERAEKFLLQVDETAKKIEEYWKIYLKTFGN
jgi:hypothetical protein